MRIALIDADRPGPEVRARWPSYGGMCADWLAPALPEARFSLTNVAEGEPFPDLDQFDGVVLSGSRAGAYEDRPWIAPYLAFLTACRSAGRPVAGICFGHQIMARAYGGRVEKSGRGWGVGHRAHGVTEAGRDHFPESETVAALSFHQDQVVSLPPGARVLLADDHSPHGGLAYPFPALSVQFHPEFGPDYLALLLDGMAPGSLTPEEMAETRAALHRPLDSHHVAEGFARFFRLHAGGGGSGLGG